jgi:hypothetical protein
MKWLEHIELHDGILMPTYMDHLGARTPGSLKKSKAYMTRTGKSRLEVENFPLLQLTQIIGSEYTNAIGYAHEVSGGHLIFETSVGATRVLVPTVVLLDALVGRISVLGDWFLRAGSIDRIAIPVLKGNDFGIDLRKKSRLSNSKNLSGLKARLAWIFSFPSGRRMFASLYLHSLRGIFGISLPMARVNATFSGCRLGGTLYVTRMYIEDLMPDEPPFAFANSVTGKIFKFRPNRNEMAQKLDAWRALGQSSRLHPDKELVPRDGVWAMTDQEWIIVRNRLRAQGFRPPVTVKGYLDIALEKFGSGKSWPSFGSKHTSVTTLQWRWSKRGQWAALKNILSEIRS